MQESTIEKFLIKVGVFATIAVFLIILWTLGVLRVGGGPVIVQ